MRRSGEKPSALSCVFRVAAGALSYSASAVSASNRSGCGAVMDSPADAVNTRSARYTPPTAAVQVYDAPGSSRYTPSVGVISAPAALVTHTAVSAEGAVIRADTASTLCRCRVYTVVRPPAVTDTV